MALALFIVFFLDYLTKFLVLNYLGEKPKKILGDFLRLNLTTNNGAAFGLGSGSGRYIAIFGIAIVSLILYMGRRIDSRLWAVVLGVMAGGICGNLSDRIFRSPGGLTGEVIDWIQLPVWPIFNFADIAITTSFLVALWLYYKKIPLNSKRLKNG